MPDKLKHENRDMHSMSEAFTKVSQIRMAKLNVVGNDLIERNFYYYIALYIYILLCIALFPFHIFILIHNIFLKKSRKNKENVYFDNCKQILKNILKKFLN